MKKLIILSLFLILIPRLIVFSQSSTDSTRIVGVKAWKVNYLIHDKYELEACKTLVKDQKIALDKADSVINVGNDRQVTLEQEVSTQNEILVVQDDKLRKTTEYDKKEQGRLKNKIFKLTLTVIIEGVIVVLVLISHK